MAEVDASATFITSDIPTDPERIRITIDGTDYEFKQDDCISFTEKIYIIGRPEPRTQITIGKIVMFDYNPTSPDIATKILCRTYNHSELEPGPLLKIGLQRSASDVSEVDWRTIRPCQSLASGGRRKKRRHTKRGRRRRSSRRRT